MLMPQLLSPPQGHKEGITPRMLSLTLQKVKRVQPLHKLHSRLTQMPKQEQNSSGMYRISQVFCQAPTTITSITSARCAIPTSSNPWQIFSVHELGVVSWTPVDFEQPKNLFAKIFLSSLYKFHLFLPVLNMTPTVFPWGTTVLY